MDFEELPDSEKGLWEGMDQAVFGELPREERAGVFCRVVDRALDRGVLGRRAQTLGGRIKALRRQQGLTPTRAAAEAGVPASRWRHWEANFALPDDRELGRILRVVGEHTLPELCRLRGQAPRLHLERLLQPSSLARVARTATGESARWEELERLELQNLDPLVREALVRCVGDPGEDRLLEALRQARKLSGVERERWLQQVADSVELDRP